LVALLGSERNLGATEFELLPSPRAIPAMARNGSELLQAEYRLLGKCGYRRSMATIYVQPRSEDLSRSFRSTYEAIDLTRT